METRSRYLLIGVFLLAVTVAGFGFVYWLNNTAGFGSRIEYRVLFKGSAVGLNRGSSVLFNGIKVGEVTALELSRDRPDEVIARIAINQDVPIASDTRVGVDVQGLMGSPAISLHGGSAGAPALAAAPGDIPLLTADPDASQDMMQAARSVLARLDKVVADNAEPLKATIGNLNRFTEALGRNSEKVDSIMTGLSGMFGGGPKKEAGTSYDIGAATTFAAIPRMPTDQLAIPEPTAVVSLDTQKILSRTGEATSVAFTDAQWSDNLPKLIQFKAIQSFENANFLAAEEESDNFDAQTKLLVDLRSFYVTPGDTPGIEVEFSAKLMVDGRVAGAQIFRATRPADVKSPPAVAKSFNEAFEVLMSELVVWTLGQM